MDIGAYYVDGVLIMGRTGTPPTPPSLVANVILRLILCPIALLLTWVPLRILWRNGEFPACTFVTNLWALILFVFVNAAIWHNQDFDSWWLGFGWCDMQAYVQYALVTLYSTSVCAIMQRLSSQVGLTRVTSLSSQEKRRRLLVQSLIIFPVPVLQIIITIFVQGQRYAIAPASGCANAYDPNAIFLVFFILPPLLFTIAACFHTFQTYRKFRMVDAGSQAALGGTNSVAFSRRQRARRKLYFMVLCILVPYTPIMAAFAGVNVIEGWPWNSPSSFNMVHFNGPVPYNSISIFGAQDLGFLSLNMSWIPIVSAYVAFVFFGTSKEAINIYREYAVALGLGYCFPKLYDVYDPDRTPFDSTTSNVSNTATQFSTIDSISHSRKVSCAPIYPTVSTGAGDVADVHPWPVTSFFRRMFGKEKETMQSTPDLELGARVSPIALANTPAAPFNPRFNWFTPSVVPSEPSFGSVSWKLVKFGAFSKEQATEEDVRPSTASPPTWSASAAPTEATNASAVPILSSSHTSKPFDGTRANSIGGRAVSTHVWSEGGPLPSSFSLGNDTANTTRHPGGRASKSENNLSSDLQQGVRVERCITTSETIR
ncbi:a-factor receptor [Sporothrix eucalyptigena]|uniref:A-factor receptor n=1 Tax=Sporothrix eucalyptigena TaxID=1812306 RepID=A0ABP0BUT5_9PEZI